MLYRGMDRAQLDAAYNNQAAVANLPEIRADRRLRSAKARRHRTGLFDLRYGDTARERLDLFLCDNPKAPTLAFIHGGYWQMGDKENFGFLAEGLLPHGFNLALIEYTLAPEARMDRIVAEVRRAILWLHAHLPEFGADRLQIYVAGHSAGGHLTAMASGLDVVKGSLAISGIFDLEPIRLNYLNEKLALDTSEARRNSPLLHIPKMLKPLVVAYGANELPELRRQSIEYADKLADRGLPASLLPIAGADHFTILEELSDPRGKLVQALVDMAG
jgi:acetyl esterase/lipase